MKKKLIRLLGYILCLPFPLSIVISIAGNIAHKAVYERWLFEKNIFPMLDWANGSYIRAIILWFGLVALGLAYVRVIVYCFLYDTPEKQYEKKRKKYVRGWLNA